MTSLKINLVKTIRDDLKTFFRIQTNEGANSMVAFTFWESSQENIFIEKYSKFLGLCSLLWVNYKSMANLKKS